MPQVTIQLFLSPSHRRRGEPHDDWTRPPHVTLAIAEGWHRGPSIDPIDDPTLIGPAVEHLMREARPNADMSGADREGPGRPTIPSGTV